MATATDPEDVTAALQVFGTTELLEQILLGLPLRSSLPTMRVSRSWAAAISGSTKLQKALFLQPCICEVDVKAFEFPLDADQEDRNPMILELLRRTSKAPKVASYVLNPWMLFMFHNDISPFFNDRIGQYISDTTGRWRSMLLTQPPVKAVIVHASRGCIEGMPYRVDEVRCSNELGVTIGDVVGATAKMREQLWSQIGRDLCEDPPLMFYVYQDAWNASMT